MVTRNPDWDKLEEKISNKRRNDQNTCKTKSDGTSILSRKEITVRRLSSELRGKSNPKYLPIGPREFVKYPHSKLTIFDIKKACYNHFVDIDANIVGMSCDVLATDQGPSCSSIEQIPNFKVIYIRFIECSVSFSMFENNQPSPPESKVPKIAKSYQHPIKPNTSTSQVSKPIHHSISLSKMLGVGKLIKTDVLSISIEIFDIVNSVWSSKQTVEFRVREKPFAEGGFRKAFVATSSDSKFSGKSFVLKRFKSDALSTISDYNQTVEQQTRKVVQMHSLANYFACKLRNSARNIPNFGETFRYFEIYFGKVIQENQSEQEFVTIEGFIKGQFQKYLKNTAICREAGNDVDEYHLKAECVAHYSYEKADRKLLLTDIQGCGFELCDPEIASAKACDGKMVFFAIGNLSRIAIKNFGKSHKCNMYCNMLNLKEFSDDEFDNFSADLDAE